MRHVFLTAASMFVFFPAHADNGRLNPRIDTSLRYGTERSLGMGEMWVPLSQQRDRVLYGDLRLMHDDRGNAEGNLGIGYRQVVKVGSIDAIAGGHAWIDRRKTDLGSAFHQIAVGGEILGRDYDVRLNGYIPLNGEKVHEIPYDGNPDPYLAGSGIFYDTNGLTVEEPQPGFDIEAGYRLPVLEQSVDAIRAYAGGYHFVGDETENVSGWRTRITADINPAISVGTRFQRDDERGSQGFIEATVRFPFDSKKSFRTESLRARLDESPERDIDIVSGTTVTRTPGPKQVFSAATGEVQRVLHVDNTAAPGGDGSKEKPFHELKLAEAALRANDVVYLHAGDGTTTGQNLGIVIDKPNVSLIGAGADFVYDDARFSTRAREDFDGTVIAEKTVAPVITNTEASTGMSSTLTGNGILITGGGDTLVSGLSLIGAQGHGLHYGAAGSPAPENRVTVTDVYAEGNLLQGVRIVSGAGQIDAVRISHVHADGNGTVGITVQGNNRDVLITDSEASNSVGGVAGFYILASSNQTMERLTMERLIANNNNGAIGFRFESYGVGAHTGEITIRDITADGNGVAGLSIALGHSDPLGSLYMENATLTRNAQNGLFVNTLSNPSINADRFEFAHLTVTDNGQDGIRFQSSTFGDHIVNPVIIRDSVVADNQRYGIYVDDNATPANATAVTLNLGDGTPGTGNNSIYGNAVHDLYLDMDGGSTQAQYNWWGNAAGPQPGQIANENGAPTCPAPAECGNVNAANPLGSDPN